MILKPITIFLADVADEGTNPGDELAGLKIYGSVYCPEHKTGLMLVRPIAQSVDSRCVLSMLEDMKKKVIQQMMSGG